jgi:chemotaxis protein MotB
MKKITLFTLLTLLLCTSCVTKKKFMLAEMAATASKDSLQGLLNNSREVGNQLSAQVKNLLRDTTKMAYVKQRHHTNKRTRRMIRRQLDLLGQIIKELRKLGREIPVQESSPISNSQK